MDRDETLRALRRGDLAGAREIRLPAGLTAFPDEVFGLADTLEVLDLGVGRFALPDDLGRLKRLRVLFCSGNPFERLPPALGGCPALSQIGFRGCGIREVPAESLPPLLRWATLTDNRIETLPAALGERPALRKLMLAGNRLAALPDSLAGAENLELIRLACNRLDALPPWLTRLPRLAWVAYAGNPAEPKSQTKSQPEAEPATEAAAPRVPRSAVEIGPLLGEGASGRVHRALWRGPEGDRDVALKLFKGAMTSDGLPEREMEACLAAGTHPGLTGALGRLDGGPDGAPGLLLRLMPPDWPVLAGPPSLASCSRDVYAADLALEPAVALRLARGIAAAVTHLHGRRLLHGDVYAHNILWDAAAGAAVLGDFGAASALPAGAAGEALARVETRAFGILLGELLDRCADGLDGLRALERACTGPDPAARPPMAEVVDTLDRAGG
ncbi:leucine-rich repeat-containing protein kinase family protein [Methylobacterium sp. NEAU 140]|uniref:leucine-rich repeat-containing protein kinase family protein n=1 Tax=Methylobacterium sp. NEAU 140 TaxID=3064945 RepID=UPI0027375D66|nr:leucine-rich repeat-containing protein kinase family protein [Methylobacterium sp. NEAU 140]MDP4024552.1 leucine-rich repeat-containing protein kinase family protein [Methylobacterium sp. NEAU 140]